MNNTELIIAVIAEDKKYWANVLDLTSLFSESLLNLYHSDDNALLKERHFLKQQRLQELNRSLLLLHKNKIKRLHRNLPFIIFYFYFLIIFYVKSRII